MSQNTNNNSLVALKNHLSASQGVGNSTSLIQRKQNMLAAREGNILLLDISGSMAEESSRGQRRIDTLWTLVQQMRSRNIPFRVAVFSTECEWSDAVECPIPLASTDLSYALSWLGSNSSPKKITLITDGLPNSEELALIEAAALGVPINVLYVGPDDTSYYSLRAKNFCIQLAKASNGQYAANSLRDEMLQLEAQTSVRLMLTSGEATKKGPIQL